MLDLCSKKTTLGRPDTSNEDTSNTKVVTTGRTLNANIDGDSNIVQSRMTTNTGRSSSTNMNVNSESRTWDRPRPNSHFHYVCFPT